jgi:transposase
MYHMDMYLTIQTLRNRELSQQQIANQLGISRRTVRKILKRLEQGHTQPARQVRTKKLDVSFEAVRTLFEQGLTARLIFQRLTQQQPPVEVSYRSVVRFVNQLKGKEVFVPQHSTPGTEAQVDFGYLGQFEHEGKRRKVWVFAMVLAHSRYAFYRAVLDQTVATFIECHWRAFEFFGGVPLSVKIDNLKAGVVQADFYDPLIQQQYAQFLAHYQSQPITARVRRPQDKGKVESAVKYVKHNFLKAQTATNFTQLQQQLGHWTLHVCNQRLHGTTRRVPAQVMAQTEQASLKPLPAQRWQHLEVQERKVNQVGHVVYRYSYYSVPAAYVGQRVRLEADASVLRIYHEQTLLTVHELAQQQGQYVSRDEHAPTYKPRRQPSYYRQQVAELGEHAAAVLTKVEQDPCRNWTHVAKGLLHLAKEHSADVVNLACQRALQYGSLSYASIRQICQQGLYQTDTALTMPASGLGGYQHELSLYDQLTRIN